MTAPFKPIPSSVIKRRLFNSQVDILTFKGKMQDAIFQHSILCQTFLPYRNPGDEQTIWKQQQGYISLAIQTNQAFNPHTNDYEVIGLPYGTKARLILAYINSQAIRKQSPIISFENSMSAFMKRMGIDVNGRNIAEIKNQLRRLTVSTISLGYKNKNDAGGGQIDMRIVKNYDSSFCKNDQQRINWTSSIQLTEEYYNNLVEHAIPLDDRALRALSHNAMAIDIYAWLAQRLHRVSKQRPQFINWAILKGQFGQSYNRMCDFKKAFRKYLQLVLTQYPAAKIKEKRNNGYWLAHSSPPIEKK